MSLFRTSLRNRTETLRVAVGALNTSTANTSAALDLGPKHTFTRVLAVKRGASSANETLILEGSHNGDAQSPTWVTLPALAMTALQTSPASGANMVAAAIPIHRWVRAKFTNGDSAQTELVLEISAFEGG